MSILLQSFATKQVQKSPRTVEVAGALMIGGEGVFLTLVHSFPAMSINMPYSPVNTAY